MTAASPLALAALARQAAFLLLQGRAVAAADLCARMRETDPRLERFGDFVDLLTWALPRERLYPLVRALVDAGFANPRSLDLLASAAIWAGDVRAAHDLTDPDRFLSIAPLHGPDEPDLPLLAVELARGLDRYDRPDGRGIRMGWRRNHLAGADSPVLRRMVERLWRAVLAYIDRLPVEPGNPFLRSRPAGLCLRAWSVVSGADTHHVSHLHATSWINGVYYVAVPPLVADAAARPGWLRVGPAAGLGFDAANGWDERWIRPEPGLVVLMPSHLSHETVPMGRDERRICVAFDLLEAAAEDADRRLPPAPTA